MSRERTGIPFSMKVLSWMNTLSVRVMACFMVSVSESRRVSCTSTCSTIRRVQAVKPRAVKRRRKSVYNEIKRLKVKPAKDCRSNARRKGRERDRWMRSGRKIARCRVFFWWVCKVKQKIGISKCFGFCCDDWFFFRCVSAEGVMLPHFSL